MKFAKLVFILIAAGLFSSCAEYAAKDLGASTSNSSVSEPLGFKTFKSEVYAYGVSQGCVACHDSVVQPYWVNHDPYEAYDVTKSIVDFSNISASKLIDYSGNSHCNQASCADPANRAVLQGLIENWVQSEQESEEAEPTNPGTSNPTTSIAPKHVTLAMTVPNPLPTIMQTARVLRFELSSLSPSIPALSGALLEIEMQTSNANTYRISRVKVVGATSTVNYVGIRVFVLAAGGTGIGVEDTNQGNAWSKTGGVIPVLPRPTTLPTGPLNVTPLTTTTLNTPILSAGDSVVIGLD